jgi:hypothetical protein
MLRAVPRLLAALFTLLALTTVANAGTYTWDGGNGNSPGHWYFAPNWDPARGAGAWTSADLARFGSVDARPNIGIDATAPGGQTLLLGAIEVTSGWTTGLTLGNNATTASVLTMNLSGLTLTTSSGTTNNVVLLNNSGATLTLKNNQNQDGLGGNAANLMNVVLANTSDNKIYAEGTNSHIVIESSVSGGQLVKMGTASLTLSGANTYIGGTEINAGAVYVTNTSGSGTGTNTVNINSTGTLGGTGFIIGNNVNVNTGGTLFPGLPAFSGSIETLTVTGAVNFAGGSASTFSVRANSVTNYDQLAVTGTVDLNNAILDFNDFGGTFSLGDVLVLIKKDVTPVTGEFNGLSDFETFVGQSGTLWQIRYNFNAGAGAGNSVVLTAVPEPASILAMCAGAAGAGTLVRRVRRGRRANTAETA